MIMTRAVAAMTHAMSPESSNPKYLESEEAFLQLIALFYILEIHLETVFERVGYLLLKLA